MCGHVSDKALQDRLSENASTSGSSASFSGAEVLELFHGVKAGNLHARLNCDFDWHGEAAVGDCLHCACARYDELSSV